MVFNIAANRANLLRIRKMLALTKEGYDLLDEKRRILMNELTAILYMTENLERETDAKIHESYGALYRAEVVMGRLKVEEISFSVNIKSDMSISEKRIMGVSIPVIGLEVKDQAPYHSPYGVSFYVDEAILKFKEVLKHLAELAEKRIALLRLADEVRRTVRKVKALEKIYIPDYENTLKYISDKLDEEGRNSFSMMKVIKRRLGR